MTIRPATPEDADAIAAIYNDAIEHTAAIMSHRPKPASDWAQRIGEASTKYPLLIAHDPRGVVAGFAALVPFDERCGYDDVAEWSLYVQADLRGRGFGRLLAQTIINTARNERQLHSIVSRVTAGNALSERLHNRLGFRHVGTFKKLGYKFDRRHDVLVYQLIL